MSDDFNIFLDTTLTYTDPLFKNNFNRNLLKLAENIENVTIYMSNVVFDETRNKFEENVNLRMKNLESSLSDLNNYYPTELTTSTIQNTKDDFMLRFDGFYNDLIDRNVIQIVEFDNDLLPVLVERSIKRIKPFGPKKQEFRDAITWLSYSKLAENDLLENCFFLTGNVNDFCEEKGKIHPELLNDTKKFKHYVSAKELFEKEEDLQPLIRTADLVEWVESENINSDYIVTLLNQSDAFNSIFTFLENYLSNKDIESFIDDAYESGYADLSSMDIHTVTDYEVEIIGDEILISGYLSVVTAIEVYLYNAYRESRHDDDYIHVGGEEIELEMKFSFSYNEKEEISHLEIDNIEVNQKGHLGFYDDDYEG